MGSLVLSAISCKRKIGGIVIILLCLYFAPLMPPLLQAHYAKLTAVSTSKQDGISIGIQKLNCSPHRKIVYVKTHKTASTSIMYILRKHVEQSGPDKRLRRFPLVFAGGYPGHFNSKFIISRDRNSIGSTKTKPEFITEHIRFDKDELQALMPIGTKYITILREPSAAFYSSFSYYYGEVHDFNFNKSKITCFNSPYIDILGKVNGTFSEYLKTAATNLNPGVPWYFRSMNCQAHDLGLDPMRTDEKYIEEQIRHLDSSFNLVMIADYFDESLVLLKEELCMDWSHLTTSIINEGSYKTPNYTDHQKVMLQNLNKLDFALYSHFNRTLWRKIEAYGRERMANDIKKIPSLHISDELVSRAEPYTTSEIEYLNKLLKLKLHPARNTLERTAMKIAKFSKFSPQSETIKQFAKYMIDNSGGCNY